MKQAEVDENTVKILQRLEEHGGGVNTCAFYSSSLIASGSGSVSTIFINFEKLKKICVKFSLPGYSAM
jgi:hypothetical protein